MSSSEDQPDREAILARRRRFITNALTALAGTTMTVSATACPCLKVVPSGPPPSEPAGEADDAKGDRPAADEAADGEEVPPAADAAGDEDPDGAEQDAARDAADESGG